MMSLIYQKMFRLLKKHECIFYLSVLLLKLNLARSQYLYTDASGSRIVSTYNAGKCCDSLGQQRLISCATQILCTDTRKI